MCVLGGQSDTGLSGEYYWNEGNGWELGGTLLRPRSGHSTITQGSSEYLTFGGNGTYHVEKWANEFEKTNSKLQLDRYAFYPLVQVTELHFHLKI